MKRRRNKKTGEIIEYDEEVIYYRKLTPKGHDDWTPYHPEDWEDYVPAEPLIKDEKIRKAVRAWAEANRVTEARYSSCHDAECEFNARDDENKSIVFIGNFTEMNEKLDLSGRTIYTIAELCGEEEE